MSGGASLAQDVGRLCDEALVLTRGTAIETEVNDIRARLDGPLRVAIAGRVKAGKSTLLNALAGERLAATDAGECTRIIAWYRQGEEAVVRAVVRDGRRLPLSFERAAHQLTIDLGALDSDAISRIEVDWPSPKLQRLVLIDTPGLASLSRSISARTLALFSLDEADATQADAIIYLMRHLHRRDSEFLEAFADQQLAHPSPVNAVAVLSRADEIGAGRADALESAASIARRYAADPRVRQLCVTVLPIAGLLAETAATLTESVTTGLRDLAALDPQILDDLLLSADRFLGAPLAAVSPAMRRHLLSRLGIFGVRYSVAIIREQPSLTTAELAIHLDSASGVPALRDILANHFAPRAQILKAGAALARLRTVARELEPTNLDGARRVLAAVERCQSSTHAFAELRLLDQLLRGTLPVTDAEHAELLRLTRAGSLVERTGHDHTASTDALRAAITTAIARWRTRAADPALDRTTATAFETAARSYEGLYAEIS